jgi:homoserine O-succinyltransferase
VGIAEEGKFRRLYVLDHLEYDAGSLADEYFRDIKANVPIKLPFNYFEGDDTSRPPQNRWRSHAHLLLSNWINEIYQTTPFDIRLVGKS